ncbi:hypothetical protein EYB26_001415 [Talaromyces marneffei]|nr:uncharacterized protein EYB26_001415 [Talaromyces marneffei]QGA13764.1 hypothetical protein EYB26_001415 [Talaromyces marneffei]
MMADPVQYTIGWICAISTEYVAAQTFLDKKHGLPDRLSPGDCNNYTLGTIEGHNVVIAVLPNGEYGTASAAVVATHMLRSFPNVRVGLMVGIGGGVPSPKHDIRLGDIVVSSPFEGQGGVVQYDFGKAIQGQSFQLTRFLNQPPMILQTAVSGLNTQYEIEGHNLHDAVCEVLEQKPRLRRRYQRPDPKTDRLYESNVIHPSSDIQAAECVVTCGDKPPMLITRKSRTDDHDNPMIHYGLIASSNQLMKNALTRDKLAAEKDVLCFEMEAAGLMNHFPCLVVRGICDYSDSHKNKEWQGYAAMVAAAYAKDLLRQIVPSQVETERKIVDIMASIQGSIHTVSTKIDRIVDIQHGQNQQAILDWLHPTDYSSQQNDFIASRQEGSGEWILNSAQFQQWIHQETATLFCPGIPGAGKTMATSIVIDHLQEKFRTRRDIGIAFIYFNFHQHIEQGIIGLFSCLLRQLSFQTGGMDEVTKLYNYHKPRRSRPAFHEILDSLKQVIMSFSGTFVLIDALDECRLPNGVLKLLSEIFELQAVAGFSLFSTSRFIPEIKATFEVKNATSMEIKASDNDMLSYLNTHLSKLPSFVIKDYQIQEKVKSAVIEAADGMFLLAKLLLYSLEDKINPRQLAIALESLPRGSDAYNEVYEDAMERIQSQRQGLRDLSFRVITWIVHAQRPLTKSEMQHALATTTDAVSLDLNNITEIGLIVSVCAGLVTVDVESNIVRLVHHTAMEYFDRMRTKWFPNAHDEITQTCVTYLSFQGFETGPSPTSNEYKTRIQTNSLYEYAARYWGYHARISSIENDKPILDFLGNKSKVSASTQAMIYHELGYYDDIQMNSTHLAAYFGLTKSMLALLQRQCDVNYKDKSFGRAPLSWAIKNGHEAVVKLLLDHNADVLTKDKSGRTPLILASENGFEAIVKLLIDKNADVRSRDRDFGRTSLSWAAKHGHEPIVRLLLDKSTERINSKDKSGNTALTWASRYGHLAVIKLLLDKGAATEVADEFSRTPLSWAVINGHLSAADLLLERLAHVDCVDMLERTPLLWAVGKKHKEMVELLLQKNHGPQDQANTGQALLWAVKDQAIALVILLLKKMAPVDFQDTSGRTPLSWAASTGSADIVKLLLANNAVIELADIDDRTPLSWATDKGDETVIKLLLDNNANIESGNRNLQRPLMRATITGRENIVKLLLDYNASVYYGDLGGRTPISWAAELGHENIVKLLLDNHSNVDSLDEFYRTPLSWAATRGHVSIVQLLLDGGAAINNPDSYGGTPLSRAASQGHEAIVGLLLKNQAVVDWADNEDHTPLALAAKNGHISVVRVLLDSNANPHYQDEHSRTPRTLASDMGHESVATLLYEAECIRRSIDGGSEGATTFSPCVSCWENFAQCDLMKPRCSQCQDLNGDCVYGPIQIRPPPVPTYSRPPISRPIGLIWL